MLNRPELAIGKAGSPNVMEGVTPGMTVTTLSLFHTHTHSLSHVHTLSLNLSFSLSLSRSLSLSLSLSLSHFFGCENPRKCGVLQRWGGVA